MTQKLIAFYSPLKPADHPVPSGDRLMAQLLVGCLEQAGYKVEIASKLRAFLRDPDSESDKANLEDLVKLEVQRLSRLWKAQAVPDLWFCYHPYYKSPDLIGPVLCKAHDISYVTAEASFSPRRNQGIWAQMQQQVLDSINLAAVNICFTGRDLKGLQTASETAIVAPLRPFIDSTAFMGHKRIPAPAHLVTVAMMRSGDKMESYRRLAASLELLQHLSWTLSVAGDGPLRDEVHALFGSFAPERIIWHGELARAQIAELFSGCAIYLWPGCGEAYGLAYLEAQAAGLPVIAYDTAGVPEVVVNGVSGLLTTAGDDEAYAAAIERLLVNDNERDRLSETAAAHVQARHTVEQASHSLVSVLRQHTDLIQMS